MAGVVLKYVSLTPQPRPLLPKVSTPSFYLSPEELQACRVLHITPQSLRSLPKPDSTPLSAKRWEDIETKRRERLKLVRKEVERRRKVSPETVAIETNRGRARPELQADSLVERITGLMKHSVLWRGLGGKEMRRKRREMRTEQEELERRRKEIVGKIRGVKSILALTETQQLLQPRLQVHSYEFPALQVSAALPLSTLLLRQLPLPRQETAQKTRRPLRQAQFGAHPRVQWTKQANHPAKDPPWDWESRGNAASRP